MNLINKIEKSINLKTHLFSALAVVILGGLGTISDSLSVFLPNRHLTIEHRIYIIFGLVISACIYLVIILYRNLKETVSDYNSLLNSANENMSELTTLNEKFGLVERNRNALSIEFQEKQKLITDYEGYIDMQTHLLMASIATPTKDEKRQLMQLLQLLEQYKNKWRENK